MSSKYLRALAVVLPQFHPIPENDEWWGKGFTEWTNVAKAKPRFKGHYQPHVPADLGFYDLRLEESRIAQAELAKKYGIYGFCYYHYWLHGKQLLERPVSEIAASGKPDFPFCLCWANETWNKNWNLQKNKVLLEQKYSKPDHFEHINYLLNIFKDKRYIKVDGKPLFIVYRLFDIPDAKYMVNIWNTEAKKAGFENGIYFLATTGQRFYDNPEEYGFDGVWDFLPYIFSPQTVSKTLNLSKDRVSLYSDIVKRALDTYPVHRPFKKYPGVCPGWDNTPRRAKEAFIVHDSTPDLYEQWLKHVCEKFEPYSKEENFVFINAMNEWAEGNHLEPDLKWGLKYLEATKRVLEKYR
ncbi:MAG: glycoside hydrolase family 99-like domain-containing protein [Chitinispirillales bacterium]|jgi:lipopolysaccharide biosynthesis protein|nr:glycoside hydrolase family 99-like domain-containing protein [Chitinispirillales bacterium]